MYAEEERREGGAQRTERGDASCRDISRVDPPYVAQVQIAGAGIVHKKDKTEQLTKPQIV